jgi:5'-3' exonuclease
LLVQFTINLSQYILSNVNYYSIKGIGPKKALAYVKQYHSIEELLKHLDRSKFTIPADWLIGEKPKDVPVPTTSTKGKKEVTQKAAAAAAKDSGDESDANAIDVDSDADEADTTATTTATTDDNNTAAAAAAAATDSDKAPVAPVDTAADEQLPAATVISTKLQVPMYQEARRLFLQPDVNPPDAYDLKWTDPDEAGLTAFLVEKMQFNAVCAIMCTSLISIHCVFRLTVCNQCVAVSGTDILCGLSAICYAHILRGVITALCLLCTTSSAQQL